MGQGSNYVRNPNKESYTDVSAYGIATYAGIPSGATVVQGIYYMWNDAGFTGKGWLYEISGGPTNMYDDFNNNDDVRDYVVEHQNLDDVFSSWAQNYTLEGWDNFYNAVGVDSGCMDVERT